MLTGLKLALIWIFLLSVGMPLRADIIAGTGFVGSNVHIVERTPKHPNGYWRSATLRSLLSGKPVWTILFDGKNAPKATPAHAVLDQVDCLPPDATRCLLFFKNAQGERALREFDTKTQNYVPNGFAVNFAPLSAIWYDDDHLLIATDTGAGALTKMGQPRVLRTWTRGTNVVDARAIFAGFTDDLALKPFFSLSPGGLFHAVARTKANGAQELYHLGWAQNLVRAPLPSDAVFLGFFQGRGLARLNSAWQGPREIYPAGSLIAWPMAPLLGPKRLMPTEKAFTPKTGVQIDHLVSARDTLYIVTQNDNAWTLWSLRKGAPQWRVQKILSADEPLRLIAGSDVADLALMQRAGQLWIVGAGKSPRPLPLGD